MTFLSFDGHSNTEWAKNEWDAVGMAIFSPSNDVEWLEWGWNDDFFLIKANALDFDQTFSVLIHVISDTFCHSMLIHVVSNTPCLFIIVGSFLCHHIILVSFHHSEVILMSFTHSVILSHCEMSIFSFYSHSNTEWPQNEGVDAGMIFFSSWNVD